MIECILEDMRQPVSYLSSGIAAAAAAYLVFRLSKYSLRLKRMGRQPSAGAFLALVYMVVLARTVYFSRPFFSRNEVNLKLIGTWGTTPQSHAYVAENLILFIPFGILLPICFSKARKGSICIISGCIFSIFIETLQWLTKRGYCQLDDIIMNTLGTALGWGIYCIWKIVRRLFGITSSA